MNKIESSERIAIKLVISIVLFNPDLLILEQVLDSVKFAFDDSKRKWDVSCIIDLVDNNPNGGYSELVSQLIDIRNTHKFTLRLIKSPRNGGYGFGNNLSISAHKDCDFHLVLNPDILLSKTALSDAFNFLLDNPCIGLLTPMVRDGMASYIIFASIHQHCLIC